MWYWIDQNLGEALFEAADQIAAGFLIVYFCAAGTGGLCR